MNKKLILGLALLMMFSGCSEDSKSVGSLGGAEEETGVYALAGKVGNTYPTLLTLADSSIVGATQTFDNEFVVKKNSIVTLFELDSVSLDTTGVHFVDTVSSDDGVFSFDDITLSSPYVLISVLDSCESEYCLGEELGYSYASDWHSFANKMAGNVRMLGAIVDLRKSKKVSVNILTFLKIPLLRKLVSSGVPFAEASKQAEKEILENYGIYEDLGSFEDPDNDENSELAFARQLVQEYCVIDTLAGKEINYGGDPELKLIISDSINYYDGSLDLMVQAYWMSPPELFAFVGGQYEALYQNTIKMLEYKIGYWARKKGLGQCTEARENEMVLLHSYWYDEPATVCRSGKWQHGFKKIEHTNGTFTDSRDGKTYKTVTYNIDGKQQTWMAQDFNYTGALSATGDSLKADLQKNSSCTYERDADCNIATRQYRWESAMNLDMDSVKYLIVDSPNDTSYMPEICVSSNKIISDSSEAGHPIFCSSPEDDECLPNLWGDSEHPYCDSVLWANGRRIEDWTWNYAELMPEYNSSSYQGICPEGWRIPNVGDWTGLMNYIMEEYGVDSSKVGDILADEYAVGFGFRNNQLHIIPGNDRLFGLSLREFVAAPDFQDGRHAGFAAIQVGIRGTYGYYLAEGYNYVSFRFAVRCIKE